MIISVRFRTLTAQLRYYAVGDPWVVKCTSEETFQHLGWKAQWDKRNILVCYPGGWPDRVDSAYGRFIDMSPISAYRTDSITISLYKTDNVAVTLLRASVFLKFGLLNRKRQERKFERFHKSLVSEFQKPKLKLISEADWGGLVDQAPLVRCSPVWQRNAEGTPIEWPVDRGDNA